jgi:hypothetical protein
MHEYDVLVWEVLGHLCSQLHSCTRDKAAKPELVCRDLIPRELALVEVPTIPPPMISTDLAVDKSWKHPLSVSPLNSEAPRVSEESRLVLLRPMRNTTLSEELARTCRR